MKKLLIILALLTCVSSSSFAQETFDQCATRVAMAKFPAYQQEPQRFLQELCAFYNKPIPDCVAIYDAANEAQKNEIVGNFVLNTIVIPVCGKTNEAK